MPEISLETANIIYRYASIVALVALVASAGAGLVIYVTSEIRGKYADESIERARNLGAQANESAAQANVKAETLTKENLQLSLTLEKERKERLELQRQLGPRTLSAEQKIKLVDMLKHLPENATILITRNESSKETNDYASEIAETFKRAGANVVEKQINFMTFGSPNYGVRLVLLGGPGRETIKTSMQSTNIATEIKQLPEPDPKNPTRNLYNWSMSAAIEVLPKPPHL
ncbi:hypothetical protein [Pseudomonas sp. NFX98]|uniref:hypothetical protein n=1 Tax=Pseudomonas sp. NFX98 TaxID=3399122 RepID=UPI0039FD0672